MVSASPQDGRRRKHSEINHDYRDRMKRLKTILAILLAPAGPYDLDFPTFGSAGIQEIKTFIQGIDEHAEWALSNEERGQLAVDAAMAAGPGGQSYALMALAFLIPDLMAVPSTVIRITEFQTLQDTLATKFSRPIHYRASGSDTSPLGHRFGISPFWLYLEEHATKEINVYDYSVKNSADRTRRCTVKQAMAHWEERPRNERSALNLLDIENRSQTQYYPQALRPYDLEGILSRRDAGAIGKTDSQWKGSDQREFFLMSEKNAVSSIHVDTGAQVTWVQILAGRKIWYFPRDLTGSTRCLAHGGSLEYQLFDAGWAKVELRAGDLLIMPPSCPHAVFTPEDCLAVGGQVYTAAHLSSSLDGLRMQEAFPAISNEDVKADTYHLLSCIFTTLEKISMENRIIRESLRPAALAISTSAYLEALDVNMANSQPAPSTVGTAKSTKSTKPTHSTVDTATLQPAKRAKPARSTADTTNTEHGLSEWESSRTAQRVEQRGSAQSLIDLTARKTLVEILTEREKRYHVAIGLIDAPQE